MPISLSPHVQQALAEMHPDPFVQVAIWRLYEQAPGLLDSAAYVKLGFAQDRTPDEILAGRPAKTGA